jgi:hypothetical protein
VSALKSLRASLLSGAETQRQRERENAGANMRAHDQKKAELVGERRRLGEAKAAHANQ